MSQSDYNIANASGAVVRADINAQLDAIATNNSGPTAPSPSFANMSWMDTASNILKQRDNANTAWINVASKVGPVWYPYAGSEALDAVLQSDITSILTKGYTVNGKVWGTITTATQLTIADGVTQSATLGGALTLTAPNDADEGFVLLDLTNDGTGGYALTIDGGFTLESGVYDNSSGVINRFKFTKGPAASTYTIEQVV